MRRLLLILGTVACRGDGIFTPPSCAGDVTLAASPGTVPDFTWEPRCAVYRLMVFDSDASPVWGIDSEDERNRLEPPIRYSVVPGGAEQVFVLPPLRSGSYYTVHVYRLERGEDGGSAFPRAGELVFRP